MPMWNPWSGCKKCSEGCLHCYIQITYISNLMEENMK